MSFEIHNAQGHAILIEQLDKEACELWSTEVHPKNYASPSDIPSVKAMYFIEKEGREKYLNEVKFWTERQNWFDWIGWKIHSGINTWEDLRKDIITPYEEKGLLEAAKELPTIWGFIDLINLWESKGYTPVQVKD